ncbi:MAG: MaoC family dehydratase N-terminal domain-containing protein [Alphaproteobacteria bacterium]|jgi:3-methylfumaryl-CoA hydratase|nr:MaoC family dehydratase N-terminal domain-containing protein [Alphaproteobacteria bacterium]
MSDAAVSYADWSASLEVREDIATPAMTGNLAATLDRDEPPPTLGDNLPWGWHWLYFPNQDRQSAVGADGLTMDSGFMPPVPFPRRMFAGARMQYQRPIRLGDRIRRESEVIRIREKEGRSGKLAFITVAYRVFDESGLCVEEEQDIVMPRPRPRLRYRRWRNPSPNPWPTTGSKRSIPIR